MPNSWLRSSAHLARGALIGIAETIPGVSGGTVALVTGVYERLISSADHLLRAVRLLVATAFGRGDISRVRGQLRQVAWPVILPILLGMAVAVLVAARLMASLLNEYPQACRAVFAGMVLASVIVPLRMIDRRLSATDGLLILVAAGVAALLTGIPPATVSDPILILVACAAAFAVCALVLPGVSGSFLLLTLGLYGPTLAAVNDGNLPYLAVFALGALIGLGLFVRVLRWLLEHHRPRTLAVMTGLMLGSLRALWPWQDSTRALEAPSGDILSIVGLFLAGAAVVLLLILAESRTHARQPAPTEAGDAIAAAPRGR